MPKTNHAPGFFQTVPGTIILVLLTVYAPHAWLLLYDHGWLKWWLILPGLPAFFLGRFEVSMDDCRRSAVFLAIAMPCAVALLLRYFPNRLKQIAAVTVLISCATSFFAYLISLA